MSLGCTEDAEKHLVHYLQKEVKAADLSAERVPDKENHTLQILIPPFDDLCAARGGKVSNGDFAMGYVESPTGITSAHLTQMERAAAESVAAMVRLGSNWVGNVTLACSVFATKFSEVVSSTATKRTATVKTVQGLEAEVGEIRDKLKVAEKRLSNASYK